MKKTFLKLAMLGMLVTLGACASNGGGSGSGSTAGSSSSGITVFGTMDAAVTGTRNR